MVNIRQKGANCERKIANDLNVAINVVLLERGMALPPVPIVQRNQNQSAVGGGDLTGTFGMSIEVKCQEQLSINTWWKQCTEAAERNAEIPVLLYKQNRRGFKCVTLVQTWVEGAPGHWVRATMEYEDFIEWFKCTVRSKLDSGYVPKV